MLASLAHKERPVGNLGFDHRRFGSQPFVGIITSNHVLKLKQIKTRPRDETNLLRVIGPRV